MTSSKDVYGNLGRSLGRKVHRNLLLKCAKEVFEQFGPEKTVVSDILNKSGISRGTFYKLFRNKDEIYIQVLQNELNDLYKDIEQEMLQKQTPFEKMNRYWLVRLKHLKRQPNLKVLLRQVYEGVNKTYNSSAYKQIKEEMLSRDIENLKNILMEGINEGYFCSVSVELTIQAVVHALHGFERDWLMGGDEMVETHISHLLKLLYHGILREDKG
ncbi:TetR/AcrR family transcriptional regulator [Microaerobacter geothermalis]|uniref:TetR/AcrR family transcriptional regulator n=1 Tax=Microaerobacter geothermalis TaxID=674972 RepID=UPI001F1DC4DB|nr:TetR/AcrR family transcriptional regulator [Microaerobacter geothermalis]MCF6095048.1 TetR/AcrR family transcriptional regulator [Microaerobacter geothermalis]